MAGGGGMQEWKVTKVIDRDFKDPWEFEDSLMGAHHRDPSLNSRPHPLQ